MKKKIIFIVGPTASGKSVAALTLAKKINGEIISADSMQIYKGLDILSAKPSAQEQQRIRHHLIDIVAPHQLFNVKKFIRLSTQVIEDIHKRQKTPIVVGGTGFYIDSLLNGLFEGPAKNASLRRKLQRQAHRYGSDYLHKKLKKVDPDAARKIHPHDLRRIVRALEVFAITGKPISRLQRDRRGLLQDERYVISIFGLRVPREKLYAKINQRVEAMFKKGAVAEVRRILRKRTSKTFRQALGIKEIAAFVNGKLSLAETKETLKRNTRHFAKRQLTWFQHHASIEWIKDISKIPLLISKK